MSKIIKFLLCSYVLALIGFNGYAQSAAFTYQASNGNICTPAIINFSQVATGSPTGFSWSFGNGASSNLANPTVIYSAAGNYSVTLTAIYDNATVQSTQVITIEPAISVSLTADRNYICTPGVINFTAPSVGNIVNYQFNFGDGSSPVNSATNIISHNYTNFGDYTVTIVATSNSGCTASNSMVVSVQNLKVNGSASPVSGCVPASVIFSASAILPIGGNITSYIWNFGDGNTATTTSSSLSHVYTIAGTYNTTVSVTTNEGCVGNYAFAPVAYGTAPTNVIAYSTKPVICGSEKAILICKATDANTYQWDYGDGITETVTDTTTSHKYNTLGTKTITVTPMYNGCPATPKTFTIDVVGLIVGFTYANTCTDRSTYSFTNTSFGNASSYIWNYGDGSPASSTANTIHTYPAVGSFSTELKIEDNVTGCRDSMRVNIFTAQPVLINSDSSICKYASSTFTIGGDYANAANSYTWSVLGQNFTSNNSTFQASILGDFNSQYVIINYNSQSCNDTAYLPHPILVHGPQLDFTSPASMCSNTSANFINNSKPFAATDTIVNWYWNYGLTSTNDSIYQPSPKQYNSPGNYSVKLVGIDKNGCKDSLTKNLIVNPAPFLKVVPQRDTLCQGSQTTLIAFHADSLVWSNAASLSCNTCDTTVASPTVSTNYVATVINNFGCITTDTARVLVFTPFTASLTASSNSLCAGGSVQLMASPPGKIISWTPAISLSNANIYNPIATPNSTTTYTAILSDSVGCFNSTATVSINIRSLPTLNAGPDIVLPYATNTTLSPLYSSNVSSYLWTPATNLSCTTCSTPSLQALQSVQYIISVTSDSGCVAKDSLKILVECKDANLYLPTAFTPNNDGVNDFFYPMTRGISIIDKLMIYNRYGQLVFQRSTFAPNIKTLGWNGKINNLPQGLTSYVYIMEATCDQGQKLIKKGSFVLIR